MIVNLSTEHAEVTASLSFPVPNSMLFQVSFFGVPNINKSYSDVSSDTDSVGFSENSIRKLDVFLYLVSNKSALCLIFFILVLVAFFVKTCNKLKLAS